MEEVSSGDMGDLKEEEEEEGVIRVHSDFLNSNRNTTATGNTTSASKTGNTTIPGNSTGHATSNPTKITPSKGKEQEEGLGEEGKDDQIAERVVVDDFGFNLSTIIASLEDDPSLPIFTFRYFFLSILLSAFGGCLAQIYFFKPTGVGVSNLFLLLLSYMCGKVLSHILPTSIPFLNPGPFNIKEHVLITVTASTASGSAAAIELIAVKDLYYNSPFTWWVGVLLVMSSQMLGYSFAGLFRNILVYPTKALYPGTLSTVSLYENLHRPKGGPLLSKRTMQAFWAVFLTLLIWEWIPTWMAPTLQGVSLVCFLFQNSSVVTKIFGGGSNNEGMALLSLSFDWNYITSNNLTWPWVTVLNGFVGIAICAVMMPTLYFNNVYNALSFPFMAQNLFLANGSSYDQTQIIDPETYQLNITKYEAYGQPYYSTTWAFYQFGQNASITAAIVHIILWYGPELYNSMKAVFQGTEGSDDPHYKMMAKSYSDVPQSWFLTLGVGTFAVSLFLLYYCDSNLEWWMFLIALLLAAVLMILTGFMGAVTGYGINVGPLIQMVGAYLKPGNPIANMFFSLYGSNTTSQALGLLGDLKLAQYIKIPPRGMFLAQLLGTVVGGFLNIVITYTIIDNERGILLSNGGSNIWSGNNVQSYNSNAITWGTLAKQLFIPGAPYSLIGTYSFLIGLALPFPFWLAHKYFPKSGFNLVNTALISLNIGNLTSGANSGLLMQIFLGVFAQYYLRRNHSEFYNSYNYLIAAALDAGNQFGQFLMTFLINGASGASVPFPHWVLNPNTTQGKFTDYCTQSP